MSATSVSEPQTTSRPRAAIVATVISVILGAVLFYLGQVLEPVLPGTLHEAYAAMVAHRGQLMAAHLLTAAGAFLLIPAAVGFARLIPGGVRGRVLLLIGAWVFGVATFSNALSQAVSGYGTWAATAPGFDPAAGRTMVDTIESGPVALPLGFWSIPAFALGAILIAVALMLSRSVPLWMPVLLAVGTVLAMAFAGTGPLVALTQAPFTVALIVLGLRIPAADREPR
jgi:hypothetical protein